MAAEHAAALTSKLRDQRDLFLLRQDDKYINEIFDKYKDQSSEMLPLKNLALAFKDLDLELKDDAEIEAVFQIMDTNCDGCKQNFGLRLFSFNFCDWREFRA